MVETGISRFSSLTAVSPSAASAWRPARRLVRRSLGGGGSPGEGGTSPLKTRVKGSRQPPSGRLSSRTRRRCVIATTSARCAYKTDQVGANGQIEIQSGSGEDATFTHSFVTAQLQLLTGSACLAAPVSLEASERDRQELAPYKTLEDCIKDNIPQECGGNPRKEPKPKKVIYDKIRSMRFWPENE